MISEEVKDTFTYFNGIGKDEFCIKILLGIGFSEMSEPNMWVSSLETEF